MMAEPQFAEDGIEKMLDRVVELGGSDLHISGGSPPMVRVNGGLEMLKYPRLGKDDVTRLLDPVLSVRQRAILDEKSSVDLAYTTGNGHRFRVNVFFQRGFTSAVFRQLPSLELNLESLGMPASVNDFASLNDGLVLVTGPTGSGKTTTLAAIIDMINVQYSRHIITIEDPIEFVHRNKKSLVTQRELYADVPSFPAALRDALREDPDVILVGEMRDLDTIRTAIMAAETGHLVFSTLHSRDASSSLDRMISVFSPAEQSQVRHQLSGTLKGVVSQRLLLDSEGTSRVPAVEVLKVSPAVANLIRVGKPEQIYSLMETGVKDGMQTMEYSLCSLFREGRIDRETALRMAKNEAVILPRLED